MLKANRNSSSRYEIIEIHGLTNTQPTLLRKTADSRQHMIPCGPWYALTQVIHRACSPLFDFLQDD